MRFSCRGGSDVDVVAIFLVGPDVRLGGARQPLQPAADLYWVQFVVLVRIIRSPLTMYEGFSVSANMISPTRPSGRGCDIGRSGWY